MKSSNDITQNLLAVTTIIAFFSASAAAQCGADGIQPCGGSAVKPTSKSAAPTKSKSLSKSPDRTKYPVNKSAPSVKPDSNAGLKRTYSATTEVAKILPLQSIKNALSTEAVIKDGERIEVSLEERNQIINDAFRERVINFKLTPEIERELIILGASAELIDTLREQSKVALPDGDTFTRVKLIFLAIRSNPGSRGVIKISGTDEEAAFRETEIRRAVQYLKYDINLIEFVRDDTAPGIKSSFFIVPKGASI